MTEQEETDICLDCILPQCVHENKRYNYACPLLLAMEAEASEAARNCESLTMEQAGLLLGISRSTVYERIVHGQLPAVRGGDGKSAPWLIPASAVREGGRR